jgi:excisionase family DNA binding protein
MDATAQHEWLTITEVAQHYRVSIRTVHRMIRSGQLRVRRIGPRLVRVHRSELNREQDLPAAA